MMDIKLDEGAFLLTRAHPTDAGLDLRSPESVYIEARQSATIRTGVHIKLPPNTYGRIASKSGLMVHHGIRTDGTIDEPYRGEICVCLFNESDAGYYVERGDKIAQLIVCPCLYVDVETVDELDETDRGIGGFGSTGR